jgi:hypothetical protein
MSWRERLPAVRGKLLRDERRTRATWRVSCAISILACR